MQSLLHYNFNNSITVCPVEISENLGKWLARHSLVRCPKAVYTGMLSDFLGSLNLYEILILFAPLEKQVMRSLLVQVTSLHGDLCTMFSIKQAFLHFSVM